MSLVSRAGTHRRHGPTSERMFLPGFSSPRAPNGCARLCKQDILVLGSVGSHNWKGAIHELRGPKATQIQDPQMQPNSYLGTEHYTSNIGRFLVTVVVLSRGSEGS